MPLRSFIKGSKAFTLDVTNLWHGDDDPNPLTIAISPVPVEDVANIIIYSRGKVEATIKVLSSNGRTTESHFTSKCTDN